jgi:hypothetical protein
MSLVDLFGAGVIEVKTWDDCKDKFKQFVEEHNALNRRNNGDAPELLFRSLPCSCYELTTTLERYTNSKKIGTQDYHEAVKMILPQVESSTGQSWPIPPYAELESWFVNSGFSEKSVLHIPISSI